MSTATDITFMDIATGTDAPEAPPGDHTTPPAATLPPAEAEDADPEAPYGRKADGSPRGKPGRRPSGSGPAPVPKQRTRKAASSKPRSSSPRKESGPDYAGAILGTLQVPMAALAVMGAKDPRALLHCATLELHGPPLAQAIGETAKSNPAVARALDKIMAAGPYAALLGAAVPMALQLLANHGIIPSGGMGTVPGPELLAMAGYAAPEAAAA